MPVETREGRIFFELGVLRVRENMANRPAERKTFVAGNAACFFCIALTPALDQIRLGEKRSAHGEELDFGVVGPLFHAGQ